VGVGRTLSSARKVTLVLLTLTRQAVVPHVMRLVFVSRIRCVAGLLASSVRIKPRCALMIQGMTAIPRKGELTVQASVSRRIEV
jgi:hypothetical protein